MPCPALPGRVHRALHAGLVAVEPQVYQAMVADQQGLKRAVRELCAAVGVEPPPAAAAAAPGAASSPNKVATEAAASTEAPWALPGRKTLKDETQEASRRWGARPGRGGAACQQQGPGPESASVCLSFGIHALMCLCGANALAVCRSRLTPRR